MLHLGRVRLGIFRNKNVFRNIFRLFRNENSSQTNAYLHYSNYSYSGLIPNECALSLTVSYSSIYNKYAIKTYSTEQKWNKLRQIWNQQHTNWINFCDLEVLSFTTKKIHHHDGVFTLLISRCFAGGLSRDYFHLAVRMNFFMVVER